MDNIVFICTGNTCRSPMAEGFFKNMGGEQKTGLKAQSAGIFTQDGLSSSQNAMVATKELGIDISNHKSKQITKDMLNDAKYIVCMTGAHYDKIVDMCPQVEDKVFTLAQTDISDPFGSDIQTYRDCAMQIKEAVQSIIERLSIN